MKRVAALVVLSVVLACANRERSKRVEYVAGVGDCVLGLLSNGCREREWPELRTQPDAVRQRLDETAVPRDGGLNVLKLFF